MMNWILTEDRLPEKDGDYLVTMPLDHTPYVFIMPFHNGKFFGDKDDEPNNKRIIAWMELPKPYKKGE